MLRKKKQQFGVLIRRVLIRTLLVIMSIVIISFVLHLFFSREHYLKMVYKQLAPKEIEVEYTHIYSQVFQQQLQDFVVEETNAENVLYFNAFLFSKKLKKLFPVISKVCVQRKTPEKLYITIIGAKPCLRFTDGRVLAHKPELFAQDLFIDYGLAKIPCVELVQMVPGQSISQSLYSFFSKIPLTHWKKYTVCYKSFEEIYLKPREALLTYECIVDKDSFFDTKKLLQAEALFHQLSTSLQPTKKRKTMFIFDLRFADRIFVSQQTGGGGNEYRHAV